MPGYELIASPTLYPGQTVTAALSADEHNKGTVSLRLYVQYEDAADQPARLLGPEKECAPGETVTLEWRVPDPGGSFIYALGVEVSRPQEPASEDQETIYLDYLTWQGSPEVVFRRPAGAGPERSKLWCGNWVNAVETWDQWSHEPFRLIQNEGRGMISTGTREWRDYRVSATVRPALIKAGGIAARVQGLRRFYALELVENGKVRLIKANEDVCEVFGEAEVGWKLWQPCALSLEVKDQTLRAWVDGKLLFDVEDPGQAFEGGGVALVIEEGHLMAAEVTVSPLAS
jgi:hypothetical protein